MTKSIEYTKQFKKRFKQRLGSQPKLLRKFHERVNLFQQGVRGEPLNDHPLIKDLKGKRAFSVTGDVRVIYYDEPDSYKFVDIGTHNQVYG